MFFAISGLILNKGFLRDKKEGENRTNNELLAYSRPVTALLVLHFGLQMAKNLPKLELICLYNFLRFHLV